MQYGLLGRTDLRVSSLSLGAMTFGGASEPWTTIGGLDQSAANRLVARALDAGINLFDTANTYSAGESERMLGEALKQRRADVIIATKVRLRTGPGPDDEGLSRSHILREVDESLRRLNTDYIDLYQIHRPDNQTPLEETLRAFEDLVRAGKVRYFGVCNFPAWQLMKAIAISDSHQWARVESVQAYYNLAARELEREIIPLIRDQELGVLVWSPLAGGLLSGKYADDAAPSGSRRTTFDFPPVDRTRVAAVVACLREIAARHASTVPRIALAWILDQAPVTSVILGVKSIEQLEDNLHAADITLSDEDRRLLDQVSAVPAEYPGWMLNRHDDRSPAQARRR